MPSSKVVRDPVHGLIRLQPDEWKVVDTARFQRLRSIRQLAMTHLVYPGAVHTRFEHSLGVRHVADQLAAALGLEEDSDDRKVVRCAALLHDVGHGPFSHVSEQVIDERAGVGGVHEAISAEILRSDQELHELLGEDICRWAADLITLTGPRTFQRDIVSGPSDADKLDYLLRDSYFAGVKYGQYDLDRVIDSVEVISPGGAQSQLGFAADGVWALEGMLLARHHMHRQVYGHKTRLATDIMITRALKAGIEEGVLPADAYTVEVVGGRVKVSQEFLAAFLQQTDGRVLEALLGAGEGSTARDLADRLTRRRLLRQSTSVALHRQQDELGAHAYANILDPEVLTPARIGDFEHVIAEGLGLEPHLVALYIDYHANPTYRRPGAALGSKDIMVARGDSPPVLFQRESEIFTTATGEEHSFAYLYTPELDEERNEKAKELLWQALKQA
jgi:putative nucleotidyltransferase with HDIG domain